MSSWVSRWRPRWKVAIAVDAAVVTEPLRLSMLGVRANSEADGYNANVVEQFDEIGIGYLSIGIEHDGPISEDPPHSPAVSWNEDYTYAAPYPTSFLYDFEVPCAAKNITVVLQEAGAPPQYSPDYAQKPAQHPSPLDMPGYQSYIAGYHNVIYHPAHIIVAACNEAGHALEDFRITKNKRGDVILPGELQADYELRRGYGKALAAQVHAQIFVGVASMSNPYARPAMGSTLSGDMKTGNGKAAQPSGLNFFDESAAAYTAITKPRPLSAWCFNNFNGRFMDILGSWGSSINALDVPAIFTQKMPGRAKIEEDNNGDGEPDLLVPVIAMACDMVTDLEVLSHQLVEAVCQSYAVGAKFGLLRYRDGVYTKQGMFYALRLLSMIPPRRINVTGADPTGTERQSLGVHVIAGMGGGMVRALVWNDSRSDELLALNGLNLPTAIANGTTQLTVLTENDAEPRVVGTWPGFWTIPRESMLLIEWAAPGATDPTARRMSLGAACRLVQAPMEAQSPVGSWGKFDPIRCVAQLYSKGSSTTNCLAILKGLPDTMYLTVWISNAASGNLKLTIDFGAGVVTVFNTAVTGFTAGQVITVALATLGGGPWSSGDRQATINLQFSGSVPSGGSANVWFSDTLTAANAMAV